MSARDLVIDSFAGGGGASLGIAMALGRGPDIAINHDAEALAMHRANHPETRHLPHNVWKVDPVEVCGGRPVGLLWASPDCKHHSKAKGGKPVKRSIRDLAWVVVKWARQVRPRVIMLENVEEFRQWGPVGLDGVPCAERKGKTFDQWATELRRLGYRVEWREMRACDYGAPTIRKRLFVIARRDGLPIVWPAPTHGAPTSPGVLADILKPWRTAAEIIDWSLPCHSIFLTRDQGRAVGVNRPLAEATMARIAKGVKRYVLDTARPFIVPLTHQGGPGRGHDLEEPTRTVTGAHRGEQALVAPHLAAYYGAGAGGDDRSASVGEPVRTVVTENRHAIVAPLITKFRAGSAGASIKDPLATVTSNGFVVRPGGAPPLGLVAAFLAQHNEGPRPGAPGRMPDEPVSTITVTGSQQTVVSAGMVGLKGSDRRGRAVDEPAATVCAGGGHTAEVRAFLTKYYGEGGVDQAAADPLHTVPTRDRFGLVTVEIDGEPYAIVDIGMRMLSPRELFRAQGFPDTYLIARGVDPAGNAVVMTKTAQVRMCGNSVCPPLAEALVRANYHDVIAPKVEPVRARAMPLFDWATA